MKYNFEFRRKQSKEYQWHDQLLTSEPSKGRDVVPQSSSEKEA